MDPRCQTEARQSIGRAALVGMAGGLANIRHTLLIVYKVQANNLHVEEFREIRHSVSSPTLDTNGAREQAIGEQSGKCKACELASE